MAGVIDDIKESKGYILGVLAFATAVSTFLTQVFHFRTEPTITVVAGFAVLILYVGFLISRSERRQKHALEAHESRFKPILDKYDESLHELKEMALDAKRDALRTQLTQYLQNDPNNEDTIVKIAREYFCKYHGDWYMTMEVNKWGKKHSFKLPEDILLAINENEKGDK